MVLQTDCDWLALHIATHFDCNVEGRLIGRSICEPGHCPAPRFYLGRTRHGNLWRIRADQPRSLVRALSRLASRERVRFAADGFGERVPAPPERLVFLRRALAEVAPLRVEQRAGLYRLPVEALPGLEAAGRSARVGALRMVASEDSALQREVRERFPTCPARCDARHPLAAYSDQGHVLSACWTQYQLPGGAAEARFETSPEARGRALAGACLVAWARAVSASGAVAQVAIDWHHSAARAAVRKLGLAAYADELRLA